MSFHYLLEKIQAAPFVSDPFRHIYVPDLFSEEHFAELVQSPEIAIAASSDRELFNRLFEQGYKIIGFPGCVTDKNKYIRWHRSKVHQRNSNNSACEGFGITLRLLNPKSDLMVELESFLSSLTFQAAIAQKFDIALDEVFYDCGIQKYLDGYEISPHPDVRKKALTYMINLNPNPESESLDHHTHYLRLRSEYRYVESFWNGNSEMDRCWVPWDWCETVREQRANNSLVIFSPNNQTMHGVKANYDHLKGQRTQLYGNLWYNHIALTELPEWEDLAIRSRSAGDRRGVRSLVKAAVPESARRFVRERVLGGGAVVLDRLESN